MGVGQDHGTGIIQRQRNGCHGVIVQVVCAPELSGETEMEEVVV